MNMNIEDEVRTVFAWLANEYVTGCVIVVCTDGTGKNVLATGTEEVGHIGAVFVAVIVLGGRGCIGAYFVSPVCMLYGMANWSPPAGAPGAGTGAGAAAGGATGPAVPGVPIAARISGANTPVMALRVNRSE